MDDTSPPTPRKPFREPRTDINPTACHRVAMLLAVTVSKILSKVSGALAAVAGPTRALRAATVGFIAMAAVDAFYQPKVVTGSWWLILLLVWLMPWPQGSRGVLPAPSTGCTRYVRTILVLAVLSWLYIRADNAVRDILAYWLPFNDLPVAARALSFPLQDIVVATLTGVLIGVPVFRAFNGKAVTAAALVTVPWLLIHKLWWFLNISNWIERPRTTMSYLFESVIAVLIILEVCGVLARRQSLAPHRAAADRPSLSPTDAAHPVRLAVTLGLFLLSLSGLVWYLVGLKHVSDARQVLDVAAPLWAVVVTTSGVAFFRAIRKCSHTVGRALEWPLSVFFLVPVWTWALLHAAPQTAAIVASRLQYHLQLPWAVTCDTSQNAVIVQGEFHVGLTRQFRSVLDACALATSVVLSSGGGTRDEGHAMGLLIKERRLVTRVVDHCASACTYAFAGGYRRILEDGASLGFHAGLQASPLLELLDPPIDISELPLAQGIDRAFLKRVAAVPHEEMWFPTNEELLAAGYVTEVQRFRASR